MERGLANKGMGHYDEFLPFYVLKNVFVYVRSGVVVVEFYVFGTGDGSFVFKTLTMGLRHFSMYNSWFMIFPFSK